MITFTRLVLFRTKGRLATQNCCNDSDQNLASAKLKLSSQLSLVDLLQWNMGISFDMLVKEQGIFIEAR